LELICYIHINPLRAGLLNDLKELDKYPWTGHSTILGRCKNLLIPEDHARESFSAARRIEFSQFRPGIEKAKVNPEHPVNPVVIIMIPISLVLKMVSIKVIGLTYRKAD
jgi:hypothetical protein